MTVAEALRAAAARLATTSDTARLDAELLMAHALGVSRSDMLLRHPADSVPEAFAPLIMRRAAHEPIAHIIGHQEFYGREFIVTPDVLIPRADSESVVEAALAAAPRAQRVLDLGTGSGALMLTLLAEMPMTTGVGVERSGKARVVAQNNAASLGLAGRAEIRAGDWTARGWADDLGTFDLVIANPPYVETGADLAPDVRDFEPAEALFAGAEGLDDYRIIAPQLPGLLTDQGIAVLEIGASQGDAVTKIAEDQGFATQIVKDLAGRDRAVVLRH
ncbi:peptide chain release factor N(5)-glutamine methyltransferase [Aurantiacibacter aquimixticola]|uniref:Release factor glutamine methyltransferase n=1 Tax=Aurantiacibacter aquimixticola TaxID=1958945 RepID=A0A419RVC6_9SPHN|nr:peptide chain release factor N(5)-glutamine methyltransferase [Aurantiacibacter aquimixticola]RJY09732.1 peptide chain release factor N(5)-glutamine methyltransferase [Aurantiacibacter aquimixticola]